MKLLPRSFARRITSVLSDRGFATNPVETEPRKSVAEFLAGIRARYAEQKKNGAPNEKKFRPAPIWYFLATISFVLLAQNFF